MNTHNLSTATEAWLDATAWSRVRILTQHNIRAHIISAATIYLALSLSDWKDSVTVESLV
jgi:hypothetical protein